MKDEVHFFISDVESFKSKAQNIVELNNVCTPVTVYCDLGFRVQIQETSEYAAMSEYITFKWR